MFKERPKGSTISPDESKELACHIDDSGKYILKKGTIWIGPAGVYKTANLMVLENEVRTEPEFYCEPRGWRNRTVLSNTAREIVGMIARNERTANWVSGHHVLIIDDLGREGKHYGNELLAEVIETFYTRWFSDRILKIHDDNRLNSNPMYYQLYITTNLTEDELEARYGAPFTSRLAEMCNIVYIEGDDARQKNYNSSTQTPKSPGSVDLIDPLSGFDPYNLI